MTVGEVIKQAQSGELANLAIQNDIPAIIQFINLGLIALYKRFTLSTGEVIIKINKDTTSADKYEKISKTDYRLPADAGAVLSAYDEDGKSLSINDEDDEYGVLTPSWDTVQLPVAEDGALISVIYQQDPKLVGTYIDRPTGTPAEVTAIETANEELLASRLPLPTCLIEALLHYIGYRAHGALDGSVQAENSAHLQRFEAECEKVRELGLLSFDTVSVVGKISRRGFI